MSQTYFCVQAYNRDRQGSLQGVDVFRTTSATEAESFGDNLAKHVAGVLLYTVTGDIEAGVLSEPEVWSRVGEVPDLIH